MTRHAGNNTTVFPQVGWQNKTRAAPVTPTSPGRLSDPRNASEADVIMLDRPSLAVSGLPYELRIAVAKSVLEHRDASQATCDLAIRALQGFDVVAEAGR